jgi:hypothetical protein
MGGGEAAAKGDMDAKAKANGDTTARIRVVQFALPTAKLPAFGSGAKLAAQTTPNGEGEEAAKADGGTAVKTPAFTFGRAAKPDLLLGAKTKGETATKPLAFGQKQAAETPAKTEGESRRLQQSQMSVKKPPHRRWFLLPRRHRALARRLRVRTRVRAPHRGLQQSQMQVKKPPNWRWFLLL